MRRTFIIALIVLALSLSVCAVGQVAINRAVRRECEFIDAAASAVMLGDWSNARRLTREMAQYWEKRLRGLEWVAAHDGLYEVREGIADVALCLEYGGDQECLRALLATGMALQSLRDAETVCWENLY